jgi:hypothetical protein
VRIDRTHQSWLVASLVIFGGSLLLYGVHRAPFAAGSMGGTTTGLAFGSAGFAFMIFAALLGARKRVPVYRFGRARAGTCGSGCSLCRSFYFTPGSGMAMA